MLYSTCITILLTILRWDWVKFHIMPANKVNYIRILVYTARIRNTLFHYITNIFMRLFSDCLWLFKFVCLMLVTLRSFILFNNRSWCILPFQIKNIGKICKFLNTKANKYNYNLTKNLTSGSAWTTSALVVNSIDLSASVLTSSLF